MTVQTLRLPDVCDITSLSRATVWRLCKNDPTFPKPFYPSPGTTCWDLNELMRWIQSKKDMRPQPQKELAKMPQIYFENIKTGKKYKVVRMDKVKKTITFQGQFGTFDEEYSKERFEKLGYKLVTVPDEEKVA